MRRDVTELVGHVDEYGKGEIWGAGLEHWKAGSEEGREEGSKQTCLLEYQNPIPCGGRFTHSNRS